MMNEIYENAPRFDPPYGEARFAEGPLLQKIVDASGDTVRGKEQKVAQLAERMWESQDELMRPLLEQWKVNAARRSGIPNAKLKNEDGRLRYWIPPNAAPGDANAMNKAAGMCRKFTSLMFTDPPAPEPEPDRTSEDADAAAIFAQRVLIDQQAPSKLDTPGNASRCFDKGGTFGSGFERFWVEQVRQEPMEVYAGFDPASQLKAQGADDLEEGPNGPWPEFEKRYLKPDGTLTDDPKEAAVQGVNSMNSELLTGRNVRMMPHDCTWIGKAHVVMVGGFRPFGHLRRQFKRLNDLSDEDKGKLFRYEPKKDSDLLTSEQRRTFDDQPANDDDKLVFVLTIYCNEMPEYEGGLELVVAAGEFVLERRDRRDPFGEVMPIPVTQYKQLTEGEDHPYGLGLMEVVGAGNEIRQRQISALFDHTERMLRRKIFLPSNSGLSPTKLINSSQRVHRMLPGSGPTYEDIPPFPNEGLNLFKIATDEMEVDGGLGQIAQGLESPQVQSGKHAQAIVAQVHSQFSGPRTHITQGFVRAGEIQLSLVRTYFDTSQRIDWVGEDGAYREREWMGADLGSVSKVRLKTGSLTMLTPVGKTQLAEHLFQMGLIDRDQMRDIMLGHLGALLGTEDDPFQQRIRRQISRWKEGPSEQWEPAYGPVPVPSVGLDGRPAQVIEERQVTDPEIAGIFQPIMADDLPFVAITRLRELAKLQSSSKYASFVPEWRFAVDTEFLRAQAAASTVFQQAQQPGQPPAQPTSPAQRTQGPLAPSQTPPPSEAGAFKA